jgi:gamma-glutamylputrescine oxidase
VTVRSPPAVAAADHPLSWYHATAQGLVPRPPLAGTITADVCVIGAGYTGLSAALHLAGRGYSVVVLEARRVGWGASGRNGGQIGSGQRREESDLEARFGRDRAHLLWDLAEEAKGLVRDLIGRHRIECDLTPGQLLAAARPAHADELRRRADKLARDYNYPHLHFLPRNELREVLATNAYHGGCLDTDAAHLHPLNYALGLARACVEAGVRIFENSAVRRYSGATPAIVQTDGGEVRAAWVVLACNAYLEDLEPRLAGWIMPINNFLLATAPLDEATAGTLIRDGICVHDTLIVLNYFRMTPDRRLLFGGGETYTRRYPADMKRFVRRHMLAIFPQLGHVSIDYAWGGTLAVTMSRLPHFGRLAPNVFFAHGYSGHGIATATLAGKLIAEAMAGSAERFDVFASLPARSFPGGTFLRWPGLVLGMLYYALRDRL